MSKKKDTLDAALLDRLYDVLCSRKDADPSQSYTAKMFGKGFIKQNVMMLNMNRQTILMTQINSKYFASYDLIEKAT